MKTCRMLLMYSMYFVVATLLFQLLAKHSSAALPFKRFVNKRLHHTTPHHIQIVSLAIIKLFSLFNSRAKTNHIDNTRPAPLSMNELTLGIRDHLSDQPVRHHIYYIATSNVIK